MAYIDILYSLEHLLLSTPPLTASGEDSRATFREAVAPDTAAARYERRRFLTHPEWLMRAQQGTANIGSKVVHALGYHNNAVEALTSGADAVSTFRYSGVRTLPYQNANTYVTEWTILLDILSRTNQSSDSANPVSTGVYSPYRGEVVDYVVQRCQANPILYPVDLITPTAPETRTQLMVRRGMLGLTPYESSQWTDSISITNTSIEDTTDIGYWALMWQYGLPRSFEGWWPTTLTITINERKVVPVESYG